MSTFDRWNKLAGILNESAEPQQTVETEQVQEATVEEAQASTMNESDLRGMIAELAKEILSEARATNYQVELIQGALSAISDGSSEIKDRKITDQFRNIRPDGKFGPKTKSQVRIFQDLAGLKVDGVVGPDTLRALISVFDNAGFSGLAHVNGLQRMVDQGVVAKQGHGLGGKKSSKKAAPKPAAPEPAAPGENPLNRVLKNLVKRLKSRGEDVDEVDVKAAIMKNMEENPEFSTNIRDLSKVANKDQFTHRLMRKIAMPVMVALNTSGSDTMVASADSEEDFDWLEDSGDVGASAATPGDPVKYDDDPASMPTLPGIDPMVFAGGIEIDASDGSGDRILTISRSQWEEAGEPDLDRIAKGASVDRVELSK